MAGTWSAAELRKDSFEFEWSVKKTQLDSGKVVTSPAYAKNGRSWCLQLQKDGSTYTLNLVLLSSTKFPVLACYSLTYHTGTRCRNKISESTIQIFKAENSYICKTVSESWICTTVRPWSNTRTSNSCGASLFHNLKIVCVLDVFDDNPVDHIIVPQDNPQADFSSLLDAGHFDVTLVAGEKELRAHKVVLSARSPIFAKMFEVDMKEKSTNKVKIDDIEPEILEKMLVNVYTGGSLRLSTAECKHIQAKLQLKRTVNEDGDAMQGSDDSYSSPPYIHHNGCEQQCFICEDSSEDDYEVYVDVDKERTKEASKLLYVSDKYQIEGLKEACEQTLSKRLSVTNVVDTLLLADKYSAKELRQKCILFIVDHQPAVSRTSEVLEMNEILKDLYQATIDKYCVSKTKISVASSETSTFKLKPT